LGCNKSAVQFRDQSKIWSLSVLQAEFLNLSQYPRGLAGMWLCKSSPFGTSSEDISEGPNNLLVSIPACWPTLCTRELCNFLVEG
jgi:hypothetical protein